ncbi:hypothetical protein DAETH_40480 (plasmid) [Deinococcus aetherius]|uniref:Uncharacterized protein n=1 Tax=Deinococcus aetherius TaxID=200252 RepID=A0ABN6RN37_9DEIO|nr:hypothetical protein [Deinococcus aetherius]BDP44079.1 hypothetical protein DAETH_40480 [Deinococcus aetherius]
MESSSYGQREHRAAFTVKNIVSELGTPGDAEWWLSWPPDVFALTSMVLGTTGYYRYGVQYVGPPQASDAKSGGALVPYYGDPKKLRQLWKEAHEWGDWLCLRASPVDGGSPHSSGGDTVSLIRGLLLELLQSDVLLENPRHERDRLHPQAAELEHLVGSTLRLHALADEASRIFGTLRAGYGRKSALNLAANLLFETTGNLSRLPRRFGIVLPKNRTPQRGLTLRSFSHHLTFHRTEVDVRWRSFPWVSRDRHTVNVLVVPWPYEVEPCDFRAHDRTVSARHLHPKFGHFGYEPGTPFNPTLLISLVEKALAEVRRVHLVVFPELALTLGELLTLQEELATHFADAYVPTVIAGVRGEHRNEVHVAGYFFGRWYRQVQSKHHRWLLDARQIKQYNLASVLDGSTLWWEDIHLPGRHLTLFTPNSWLTLCPLICEDLAQIEPVSDVIRGVGPTLMVALLMDGPQLAERWSARYVSVFADDPGTSVLTVTSLGMAERSRAPGFPPNRTVALWRDAHGGTEAITLGQGEAAALLTLRVEYREEVTADGRSDGESGAVLTLQGLKLLGGPKGLQAPSPPPPVRRAESLRSHNRRFKIDVPLDAAQVDSFDLTVLAYFVNATLEMPLDLIERSIALICEKKADLDGDIRGGVAGILADRLCGMRTAKKEPWPPERFRTALLSYHDFIREYRTQVGVKTQESATRGSAYPGRVKDWLALVDNVRRKLGQLMPHEEEHAESWREYRPRALPFVLLLWSLHNRIMYLLERRPQRVASEPRVSLLGALQDIERCLDENDIGSSLLPSERDLSGERPA